MVLQKFNIDTTQSVQTVLDIIKYKMKQGSKPRVPSTSDGAVDHLSRDFAKVGISSADGNQLMSAASTSQQVG